MPSFRMPSRNREQSRSRDQSRTQKTQRSKSRNPFGKRSRSRPDRRSSNQENTNPRFEHVNTNNGQRRSFCRDHSEVVIQTYAAAQNVQAAAQAFAEHESGKRPMRYSMQCRVTESALAAAAGAQKLVDAYESAGPNYTEATAESSQQVAEEVCELEGDCRYSQYMETACDYQPYRCEQRDEESFRDPVEATHGLEQACDDYLPADEVVSPGDSGYASDERSSDRGSKGSYGFGYTEQVEQYAGNFTVGTLGGAGKDVGEVFGTATYHTTAGLGTTDYNIDAGLGGVAIGIAR